MSQRLLDITRCLCYVFALQTVSIWTPVKSVTVRTPPSNPSTIEAQAKFFQDFFSVQLSPYKIEFGHVCEDPNTWEQRYEKKDFKNHRDMGKVRWGDKKGGYGEHYWDLNHAGHAGDHGDDGYESDHDDGAYHETDHDSYDEPSENSPSYGKDEYNPEKSSSYDESGRAKRAHPRVKLGTEKPKKENNKDILQSAPTHQVEYSKDEETYKTPRRHPQRDRDEPHESYKPKEQKNQVVLVVSEKDDDTEEINEPVAKSQPDLNQYVPYEGGAGVRQHQHPEVTVATSVPRLFLEPSTGHVVDRATGQAYVLQPIAINHNYKN